MGPVDDDDTVDFIRDSAPADGEGAVPEFPGYSIEGELGRGGLGVVYRARDLTLNRPVALKVLSSHQADHEHRQTVLEEARRTAALGDRCIVTIYGVLEYQGHSAIAMELVDGHELQNVSSVLEPRQIAKIISEVAGAVSSAHRAGILHRDIKPQNIVVTPAHEVRILDFGLSIEVDSTDIEDGFSGTIAYAAPERLRGEPATTATDIFSLGVLFHEALTGRHPYAKLGKPPTISSILAGEPSLPREHRPEIPEDLERICLACLSFKPEDRPDAGEVHYALTCFLAGQPVQMKATVVKNHLLNRIEEHVSEVGKWRSLGLVADQEHDQIRWQYRRVLEGDDLWPTETRKLRAGELGIYISIWAIICSALLAAGLYREDVGSPLRWLIPLSITIVLAVSGAITQQRSMNRVTPLFIGGAILSLMPTLISVLTEWIWIPGSTTSADWLHQSGVANKSIFIASLLSLIASVIRLNITGVSFFAWLSAVLFVITQMSLLLMMGFMNWSDGAQACGILSISIAWLVGTGFEWQHRPRFARPFHWIGAAGIILGLYLLGSVPMLTWFGFDSLSNKAAWGWSQAIAGSVMLVIGLVLDRSVRLERRRIAKYFEWICPVFLLGGLYSAALSKSPILSWEGSAATWLAVGPFILAVAMFIGLTARRWKSRFMISGMAGVALSLHLLQAQELVSKKGLLVSATALGVLLTAFFYFKMELTTKKTKSVTADVPSIHDD